MAPPTRGIPFLCTVLFLAVVHLPARAQAQVEVRPAEAGEIQEVRLTDGSTLVGRVIASGDPIRFELASGGVVELARAQIRELRTVRGKLHDGAFWARDPSANRLFFGPTARTIGEGHGYLAVFEAFFPSVSVGLTDEVTMGGGTILRAIDGADRPFWLVPKVKLLEARHTALSVGALAITNLDHGWAGILYGVLTRGDPDNAVTLGLGYGWVEDDFADSPAVLFGAETRVARGAKLITENYLIPTGAGARFLFSGGPRFFTDRLSADVGIAVVPGEGGFFPLVNFVYNW